MWFPKMLMVVAITSSRVCSEIQWSYERAHALRELMYVCSAKKKKEKKKNWAQLVIRPQAHNLGMYWLKCWAYGLGMEAHH